MHEEKCLVEKRRRFKQLQQQSLITTMKNEGKNRASDWYGRKQHWNQRLDFNEPIPIDGVSVGATVPHFANVLAFFCASDGIFSRRLFCCCLLSLTACESRVFQSHGFFSMLNFPVTRWRGERLVGNEHLVWRRTRKKFLHIGKKLLCFFSDGISGEEAKSSRASACVCVCEWMRAPGRKSQLYKQEKLEKCTETD